jgi:deazaflavin-dependent oxidoreductase (nitroreductase family)
MPVHVSRKERVGLFLHRGLDKWLSPVGVWVMRRTKGSLAGRFRVDALVLTTVGRRSGRMRNVVLQFFPDGDAFIVTAVNGGDPKDPAWYLNLSSTPTAQVEVLGRTVDVRAEELPPDEATAWWRRILARSPSTSGTPARPPGGSRSSASSRWRSRPELSRVILLDAVGMIA